MRICMMSTCYPPRVGGLETHVAVLAEELARQGHEVTVFTNRDLPSQPADATERDVRVLRAGALLGDKGQPDKVPWEEAMFGLLRDVDQMLAEQAFDIVHAHTQAALLLASLSGLSARLPTVASPHETEPETDPCGRDRSRFIYSAAAPDIVLVGSRRFQDQIVSLGVPVQKVRLVYHGLPALSMPMERSAARRLLRQRYGLAEDGTLITLLGRFKPRKGQLRLLETVSSMRTRTRCRILLAGSCNSADPEYLAEIHKRISADLRADQFAVIEDCMDDTRDVIWAATDIATQPSSQEGLGLACVEAMLSCVPVVAADVGGLREVVTPATGVLVDTTNPAAYAAALDHLVDDAELRHRLGCHGQSRARSLFTAERTVNETLKVYREAIAARHRQLAMADHQGAE